MTTLRVKSSSIRSSWFWWFDLRNTWYFYIFNDNDYNHFVVPMYLWCGRSVTAAIMTRGLPISRYSREKTLITWIFKYHSIDFIVVLNNCWHNFCMFNLITNDMYFNLQSVYVAVGSIDCRHGFIFFFSTVH